MTSIAKKIKECQFTQIGKLKQCVLLLPQAAFSGFKGEVWSTYSDIGRWRFGIILAANMTHTDVMDLGPTSAGLNWEGVKI